MHNEKHILITGGSGFVGSQLVNYLLDDGAHLITVLDKDTSRLKEALNSDRVQLLQCDLTDKAALQHAFSNLSKVEVVVHLASLVDPSTKPVDARRIFSTNTMALLFLLETISPPESVIYPSSVSVYGLPAKSPVDESHSTEPFSYYGASKLAAENFLKIYAEVTGVRTCILRITQLYGFGMHPSSMISNFVERALKGQELLITCDPMVKRDFLNVQDAVRALALATKGDASGVWNIGSGEGQTIISIANRILSLTHHKSTVVFSSQSPGYSLVFDISRARKELGFSPTIPFKAGIKQQVSATAKYLGVEQ